MRKWMIFLLATSLALSSCNLPMIAPEPSPTPPPTATLPPTDTPPPTATLAPTNTDAAPLPEVTNTPEGVLFTMAPTATQPGAGTPVAPGVPGAPTATLAPFATQPQATAVQPTLGVVQPQSRALFEGTFTGGFLTFRIGELSSRVIPKQVVLKGATCKDGRTISGAMTFEPPPSFIVDRGKFTITWNDEVTISGQFLTPTRAAGTISLNTRKGGKKCVIGPLSWSAAAGGGG